MSHDSPPDGGRQGQADAWSAFSLVLSGVLVWGGAGWLVSEWLDNSVFLMVGLLVGTGAALYIVWFRYGRT